MHIVCWPFYGAKLDRGRLLINLVFGKVGTKTYLSGYPTNQDLEQLQIEGQFNHNPMTNRINSNHTLLTCSSLVRGGNSTLLMSR